MGRHLPNHKRHNPFQLISTPDLVSRAHILMGSIDLDPASSAEANKTVQAKHFFTAKDDPINEAKWFGNVYLFPPTNTYFWHQKTARWKLTRGLSTTLVSGGALWWRTLKKKWINREVQQAVFFSNQFDMFMYCQDLFDHPLCIFDRRPRLPRLYDDGAVITDISTGSSFVAFLHPLDDVTEKTELFIETYKDKGRILV